MKTGYIALGPLALGLALAGPVTGPAGAASETDFFTGKTVKVVVGFPPGGGYDQYARLLARHYGTHLPGGKARAIVQNMPGASGIKSGNYLYEVAPKDGSVIAIFNKSMPTYEILGRRAVRFKSADFGWIGGIENPNSTITVLASAGVGSLDDAMASEVLMGAASVSGTQAMYPALINNLMGTKFRVIAGYKGSKAISLAMERGEVTGISLPWSSWSSIKPDWLREGKLRVLAQLGLEKDPSIPGPFLLNLIRDTGSRAIVRLISTDIAIGRTYVAPPGLAPDRLNSLRRGYDAALRDSKLVADAKRLRIDVMPSSGEKIAELVAGMFQTPKSVIEKTKAAISIKGLVAGKCKGSSKMCRTTKGKKAKK
jgi:tripartite-type tricarboxylate transporter receptor subunit TctC